MAPIATVSHVQRRFGSVLALSDVSFELEKGVTGLLGGENTFVTTKVPLSLPLLVPSPNPVLYGGPVTFQGTLQGSSLAGTIKGDRFTSGSTASGTLSGATFEITLNNSFGFIPGGRMHLHR